MSVTVITFLWSNTDYVFFHFEMKYKIYGKFVFSPKLKLDYRSSKKTKKVRDPKLGKKMSDLHISVKKNNHEMEKKAPAKPSLSSLSVSELCQAQFKLRLAMQAT